MENAVVNYVDLGKKIMQLRKDKKMTQKQLAELVGVSMSFMGLIERGERKASLETIVSIANALEVGLNYLLSASLNTFERHMPSGMSPSDRLKLGEFLRLAQDTIKNWNE
jgi:transcriptional regulator with XRE-family HTH domain